MSGLPATNVAVRFEPAGDSGYVGEWQNVPLGSPGTPILLSSGVMTTEIDAQLAAR